jgi:hypothetical protein
MTAETGAALALALATASVAFSARAEDTPTAEKTRTVCEWVVEPRYVGSGAPKLEPQRVCRTETVQRPAPAPAPEGVRPAGEHGTGIVVESAPAPSLKPEKP